MQYWSAVVYNAEVAVKFSELPSIQNYPELPYCFVCVYSACVLFCVSEMRPMKLFVLGFRVVAHTSMLPVRGAHASVFPHQLFSFYVFSFDCNVPPWGYSNEPLNPL